MSEIMPFILKLEPVVEKLKAKKSLNDKYNLLCELVKNEEFLTIDFINTKEKKYLYKALQFLEQDQHLFYDYKNISDSPIKIQKLFDQLWDIETFYAPIGGILGYHLSFLKLIMPPHLITKQVQEYEKPEGTDLTRYCPEVDKAIRQGIESFGEMGEIYPVAGAGDRLNLKDDNTGEPLPAAVLKFLGFSLIHGLIRDLQAREFLHFKCTGNQVKTPIILMTSNEKNNDQHIKTILKEQQWFHRSSDLFFSILQPLVPVIRADGLWAVQEPLCLNLKPGGHGVLWQLAEETGALNWLLKKKRGRVLVRQINNPIAGVDSGLLALAGIGCAMQKSFGFATCFRKLGTAEGIDVLIEKETEDGFEYSITNIEYTEFEKFGIKDVACSPNSPFSLYPSNTNILFVDLLVLKEVLIEHPFPGFIVNLKSQTACYDKNRNLHKIEVGRLESTMQNIADYVVTKTPKKLSTDEKKNTLKTFVTYNDRQKTISTTKKLTNGENIQETPEGVFYDFQCNAHTLFTTFCHFRIPELLSEKTFVKQPSFIITYHPGLGPLYQVIGQKIKHGRLANGSELKLEIAEVNIHHLNLKGSLHIYTTSPLGHLDSNHELIYSNQMGKCVLKNVQIKNEGIDFSAENVFWKSEIVHKELMDIQIAGNGEFFAENVAFNGPFQINVPDGHRVTATMQNETVQFTVTPIDKPTWMWDYSFDEQDKIQLQIL